MINCEKCGKENQDHYKFCLGCGAELPRKEAPRPFAPQTPPHGVPAAAPQQPAAAPQQPAPAAAPQPQPAPPEATTPTAVPRPATGQPPAELTVDCPQCGQPNPKANRFCAACGYNLGALAGQPAPAPAAAPAPAFAPAAGEIMPAALTALRADGSEAGHYDLPDVKSVTVGRDTGGIFAGDSYLSPRHATVTRRGTDVFVKDAGSLNGVYLKLRPNEPWQLNYADVFRIGQEIIRFEELKGQGPSADGVQRFGSPAKGYIGRISLVIGRDTTGNSFPIPEQGIHLGRERGDVLFSEDGYVSGLHCQISRASDGGVHLMDVGSSNGTFARLTKEYQLEPGDILLMGQQLFRVDF